MTTYQLKLNLFQHEVVESEISIGYKVKLKGTRRAYFFVLLERWDNMTSVIIRELHSKEVLGKTLVRFLSGPGIFNLPFDIIISGLSQLSQLELLAFSKRKISEYLNGDSSTKYCYIQAHDLKFEHHPKITA